MAESSLIRSYLDELRFSLGRLADVDDVVAEVQDHLETSVESHMRGGIGRQDAETRALAQFGSPALVSRVFAEEAKRGGAVSTTLTRRAGIAAMVAPALMIGGIAVASASNSTQPGSAAGVLACLVASALFFYALYGLRVRHGGLGTLGRVAFWMAVLAVPFSSLFSWEGMVVLAVLLGVVVALFGIAMLRASILPRAAVALFAFSWPVWAPIAWLITAAGDDANKYAAVPVLITLGALMWIGLAMWREPALDARHSGGPLAAA